MLSPGQVELKLLGFDGAQDVPGQSCCESEVLQDRLQSQRWLSVLLHLDIGQSR
jgi:hypothetical protein